MYLPLTDAWASIPTQQYWWEDRRSRGQDGTHCSFAARIRNHVSFVGFGLNDQHLRHTHAAPPILQYCSDRQHAPHPMLTFAIIVCTSTPQSAARSYGRVICLQV
ncbi:hypothetical protein J1614_011939 [Plenodomus biglobosus]|nr:hypothetical protein J1614_011939 [Plenodomus biglobosus]